MTTDIETLKTIPNGKPVRIFLPLQESPDMSKVQCLYETTEAPKFTLLFKPGSLPVDDLDSTKPCIITIDMGGPTLTLEALIAKIVNPQTLMMTLQRSISHEQMREFFRVDTETSVVSKSLHDKAVKHKKEPWELHGRTIDLSGSGILAIFDERPPADHQVRLQITIPSDEPETVSLLAHQVRLQRLNDGSFEVAYHFDDITIEDRDKIIGCCLIIQRRMLRLKVQVRDN